MTEFDKELDELFSVCLPDPLPEPLWSATDRMNYERSVTVIEHLKKGIKQAVDKYVISPGDDWDTVATAVQREALWGKQ